MRERVDAAEWREALLTELQYSALLPERRLTSIFFGGGTPSLMAPETVGALIAEARNLWDSADDLEITLEANPTSVEAEKFSALRAAELIACRSASKACRTQPCVFLAGSMMPHRRWVPSRLAAEIFPRYSFDLIYSRAGQTLTEWEAELRAALPLARGHTFRSTN